MKLATMALAAVAILTATFVAACGDGDNVTSGGTPAKTPQQLSQSTTPPATPTAVAGGTATPTAVPVVALPPSVIASVVTLPPTVTSGPIPASTPLAVNIANEPAFGEVTLMARALSKCTGVDEADTQTLLRVAESDLSDDLVACINNYVTSLAASLPAAATPTAIPVATSRPVETTTPNARPTITPVPVDIVTEPAFDAVTLTARAVADCTGIDVTATAALLQAATSELTDELVACINEFLAKENGQ